MNQIKPSLFRELKRYSLDNVKEVLGCKSEEAKQYLNTLRKYGIVKLVKKNSPDFSDMTNDDLLIADSAEDVSGACYKFDFVGVAAVKDRVFFSYPKYVADGSDKEKELKFAIKAIRKYDANGELVHLHNHDDKTEHNKLALALHILQDYFDNGIYTNYQEIIETNGEGEIDWDRTINETFAYLKDNRPYYLELKTISSQSDDFDYFKRLHECVVTQCSEYLDKLSLLDLFDIPQVLLSEQELKDFGDTDYILYRLEREIANQFVTRKQNLLKTLYTFVAEAGTVAQENAYSLYGTNCMNLVWEKACGEIFGNEYGNLKNQIPQPRWYFGDSSDPIKTDTLIPDIVTSFAYEDYSEVFCILDGKYYLIQTNGSKISGNPGVQDIVKQFVYHKAFMRYIQEQKFAAVLNGFLFPECETLDLPNEVDLTGNIRIIGRITMMDWGKKSSDGQKMETLVPIFLIFLKPSFVWDAYIQGSQRKGELVEALKKYKFFEGL